MISYRTSFIFVSPYKSGDIFYQNERKIYFLLAEIKGDDYYFRPAGKVSFIILKKSEIDNLIKENKIKKLNETRPKYKIGQEIDRGKIISMIFYTTPPDDPFKFIYYVENNGLFYALHDKEDGTWIDVTALTNMYYENYKEDKESWGLI